MRTNRRFGADCLRIGDKTCRHLIALQHVVRRAYRQRRDHGRQFRGQLKH